MARQMQQTTNNGLLNVPTPSRNGRGRADAGQGRSDRSPMNALESTMSQQGIDAAWRLLEEMQQRGVPSDKFTVSRMLMKTVGDGRGRCNTASIYRGISLVEKFMDLQPSDVDGVLCNALLDTCCRLKDLHRLEGIVSRMRELKVTPSPVTLGILVKTYGQAGDLQKVLSVWDEMEAQRGLANAVTFGCMIDACVKCGALNKALEIFDDMKKEKKHKNTILYTTLIKGFGLERDLRSALALFQEMSDEGVPCNTITYNSIIDACIKCSDLPTAESLMRQMTAPESNLKPDLITFSTLLKGYCHVGDLDKALQVAESIKSRGLRCDELVYNTLMDGCVKAHDAAVGLGLFEEMIRNGMKPSSITHSILARLHQTAGFGDDATEAIAVLYQYYGLERPASKTWLRRGGGATSSSNSMAGTGTHSSSSAHSMLIGYSQHLSSAAHPSSVPVVPALPQGTSGWNPSNGLYLPIEELQPLGRPQTTYDTSPLSCSPVAPSSAFASMGYVSQSPCFPFNCGSFPSSTTMSMQTMMNPMQCAMADWTQNQMGAQQICGIQAGMPDLRHTSDASSWGTSPTDRHAAPALFSALLANTGQAHPMPATSVATGPEQFQPQAFNVETQLQNNQELEGSKALHVSPPQALPACTTFPGRFGG